MGTNSVEGPVFAFDFDGGSASYVPTTGYLPEESVGLNYYLYFMKNNEVFNQPIEADSNGSVIYQGIDEYGNNFEITINNSHSTGNTYSTLSESETFIATLNFINYPIGFEFSYSS